MVGRGSPYSRRTLEPFKMGFMMADDMENGPEHQPQQAQTDDNAAAPGASRRRFLQLGAAGAVAALTVRPAYASAATSVLNCEIPVPDPARAGMHIAPNGSLVPPGTQGAFPPAPRPFRGEDVRAALSGRTLPGTSYSQNNAYLNYIRQLRAGQNGFTCFASIQMPR